MNTLLKIIFALSLLPALSGCKGVKNKAAGPAAAENRQVPVTVSGGTIEDVYTALPRFDLPLGSGAQFLQGLASSPRVAEADMERLTGIGDMKSGLSSSARLARLPEKEDKRFIIAGKPADGEWVIDLYCLTEGLNPGDRLRVYSVELLPGGRSRITQTFSIDTDYRIQVSKHLNGVLIERLTYMPAPGGTFEELRNGQTTTVAYDSYDGVNYIVRTFIWDRNTSGALVMKDLREEIYRLDDNGDLVQKD